MKLSRLSYEPGVALAFYEEAFGALGGLCERTWHDRLEIAAQGEPARLWNDQGAFHSQELVFAPADAEAARDAAREVFPGCPLTFRLTEILRPRPVTLEKAVLRDNSPGQFPDPAVLEKLWRAQFPATRHWRVKGELKLVFHFSLVAVLRCEIQAIDQHWSVHRVAVSLPDGEVDDLLAQQLPFLELEPEGLELVDWLQPVQLTEFLAKAVREEIADDLEAIRLRQEHYLQREVQRIDEYFAQYERELEERASRKSTTQVKAAERLKAARAEHARRRSDQVARHEIRVQPHVDSLLLVAERAWTAPIETEEQRAAQLFTATFVTRARRWFRA